MDVKVIDRHGTKYNMSMKFYNVINAHRIISPDWKKFVRNNELQGGRDAVFPWVFKVRSELWFAIDHGVNPHLEAGANEGDAATTVETRVNEGDAATTAEGNPLNEYPDEESSQDEEKKKDPLDFLSDLRLSMRQH
ncbi:hypothetical protein J5N97_014723 [Dioscorea zingiberensis]|uniref:TF-B3 domain-containing protein n=1 Tax=Dioscorea zingiberensis TaxID=325984 RepID=A0A9D5HJX0_9LILI|nr:hypothetical protein J5N97_014723 [Dioscorea zingiberensis]